jgi:hypothetical protein
MLARIWSCSIDITTSSVTIFSCSSVIILLTYPANFITMGVLQSFLFVPTRTLLFLMVELPEKVNYDTDIRRHQ